MVGARDSHPGLQMTFRFMEDHMLWTIAIILIIMWLLGMVTANAIGGFIHILLVIALIAVLVRIIQGRPL